jgi:recombination protein RecA
VDRRGEVLDLCLAAGVLEKAGSWFRYGERQLGQGRSGLLEALAADPAMEAELSAKVLGQAPTMTLVPVEEGGEGEAAEG